MHTRDAVSLLAVATVLCCSASQRALADTDAPEYLRVVRAYADAMIEHGRDAYGKLQSPLFAATLDRKTLRLPEKPPPIVPGIRGSDRTLTGANPMHDMGLYQVLYALTEVTGNPRYANAADETLTWFFEHCQSGETGIFAWGEHLGWDFTTEGPLPGRDTHEFYRPWVLWDRSFQLAPEACQRFALGLWQHQIADQKTGAFSRHALYSKHGPAKGSEYPRHGGFYIAAWAAAYERSKDPELLEAIEVLVTSFDSRRNKRSGAIPSQSGKPELLWPQSNLSLAIDLEESADRVPAELAAKMRQCGSRTDQVFLRMKHDLTPQGSGFIKGAVTSTLEPAGAPGQNGAYTHIWATGYGELTDAQVAMLCLLRYQQVKLDGYRMLFLAAAERYLKSDPDTSIALYPGALAEAIAVMLGAYRLTGEGKYLDRADEFGKAAVRIFFDDSPLPRASSQHDHYEAITRGDTLAMELLDLHAVRTDPKLDLGLVWPER